MTLKENEKTAESVVVHLSEVMRRYAHEFLGVQEVQVMLDALEQSCPALVKAAIPKYISVAKLTEVLKRLVRERISIKDMKSIMESIARYAPVENEPGMLTEYARAGLSRYVVYKCTGKSKTRSSPAHVLPVYLLDPHIEMMVQESVHRSQAESYLALDPEVSGQIIESSKKVLNPSADVNPVILTHVEIRYFIWKLLENDFPNLMVLSYQELPPEVQIQPLGRICVDGPASSVEG